METPEQKKNRAASDAFRKSPEFHSEKVSRARQSSHEKALSNAKKGGHKQGEREVRSKKAGFYVQGHKNYGDVYEA